MLFRNDPEAHGARQPWAYRELPEAAYNLGLYEVFLHG